MVSMKMAGDEMSDTIKTEEAELSDSVKTEIHEKSIQ